MIRAHESFCILQTATADSDHGDWCVSEPVGRELSAFTDTGPVEITVDLAAPWIHGHNPPAAAAGIHARRYVRVLIERHVAGRYERYDLYLQPRTALLLASYQATAAARVLKEFSDPGTESR